MSDPLNSHWSFKSILLLPMAVLAFGPLHFLQNEAQRTADS